MTSRSDNRNFILAVVLSILIIFAWQYFYAGPVLEKHASTDAPKVVQTEAIGLKPPTAVTREAALEAAPRVRIETPTLLGSLSLKGAAIDDLRLRNYRETVDPLSPIITLLSPSGTTGGYFIEQGWTPAAGATPKLPQPDTLWQAPQGATLSPGQPVTLAFDNGEGLLFKRTIAVDERYLFTIRQEVENRGAAPVSLVPYARVQRQGTPQTAGIYVLYEGPHGVLGAEEQRHKYAELAGSAQPIAVSSTGGWLGFTDKYWAVALIPDQKTPIKGEYLHVKEGALDIYQTHYLGEAPITVPPGGNAAYESHVFAGAKVVQIINDYRSSLGIDRFDLVIDWGWFYFLTKPLFYVLEYIKDLVGNFGLAILITTVLVKLLFFPLQNKSYESMSKMKKLQPEMQRLKERFPDDRMKQQQEMMELYKREKVSPVSGCLPVVIQIPVFFALYKVIYTTIELRQAPFFGWVHDLSAPDPTTVFNLFGLIPWAPPHFLVLGLWPLIMGVTMWLQMRLNPTPPDPVQATMFNWMPVMFTFMLASFPVGLVIYWAWNNTLSILQQSIIMKRQGVKIDFFGNVRNSLPFLKKRQSADVKQ